MFIFLRRFFQICFNRVSEKCGLSSLKLFKSESLTKESLFASKRETSCEC